MTWIQGLSRTTIFLALAVAFLAVQSITAAGFLSLLHFRSATQSVSRAQDILLELESMVTSLTNAETGRRGHILTSTEPFLFPYPDALDAVRGHLRRLIDLTEENSVQQRHIAQLVRQVDERMDQLNGPIAIHHVGGMHSAGHVVLANSQKPTMSTIQQTVEEIRKKEAQHLRSRSEDSTIWAITAGALSVIIFLLMFVVFGFAFVIVALALGNQRREA